MCNFFRKIYPKHVALYEKSLQSTQLLTQNLPIQKLNEIAIVFFICSDFKVRDEIQQILIIIYHL